MLHHCFFVTERRNSLEFLRLAGVSNFIFINKEPKINVNLLHFSILMWDVWGEGNQTFYISIQIQIINLPIENA